MPYETVIGLEIHIRPKTKSKMFCACANVTDDSATPNSAICPICLGHPGTLPVVNRETVELGATLALALDCQIPTESKFDRKNYFYPDLPKNYQISMYDKPIGVKGSLEIESDGQTKKIGITRLHLEEDAAKLLHVGDGSLIDFNRGGAPLMEIVTEPEIRSPKEARIFLQELRLLARYLDVSNADMEKGQLRCDANISLRPLDQESGDKVILYPKTEIKNLNSFKAVEKALEYEIQRQTALWDQGTPPRELTTRGWDDDRQETIEQRAKEGAHDYRYFPEPDIPPLKFGVNVPKNSNVFDINVLRSRLIETPAAKRRRFAEQYGLAKTDARLLVEDKEVANFTEQVISELKEWLASGNLSTKDDSEQFWQKNKKNLGKLVSGWIGSRLFKLLNESDVSVKKSKITPENFAELLTLIWNNKISSSAGQTVLEEMFRTGGDPSHIVNEKGLAQESDGDTISQAVADAIKDNPGVAADYRGGKVNALQFLAGQVMKATKGKANPQMVQKVLKDRLS